ncbi:caspase b-like [Pungitius pungitius]|uniref:caspase b-like n=1 Tax=Pungitius pungitius TaxID=134920 RepID=UPI002E115D54
MSVRKLLLEVLEDLLQEDFKTFKWHLGDVVLKDLEPIPKSRLEAADRTDTVGRILESYGEKDGVRITVEVLKLIRYCHSAEKLMNTYKAGGGAASSSAPGGAPGGAAPAAPSAPAVAPSTMTAQDQGVLFAPLFAGGTVGTMNVTINK